MQLIFQEQGILDNNEELRYCIAIATGYTIRSSQFKFVIEGNICLGMV